MYYLQMQAIYIANSSELIYCQQSELIKYSKMASFKVNVQNFKNALLNQEQKARKYDN